MTKHKLVGALLVLGALTACSDNNDEPKGAIPQAQKDALEKARAVEDTLKKQAEETRRRADET